MIGPIGVPGAGVEPGVRFLKAGQKLASEAMHRLSTGRRINAAKDAPAGLIAAEHLTAALRALDAESRAVERESSLLATREGVLAEAGETIADLRGLAVRAASTGGVTEAEAQALDAQAAGAVQAIDRAARSAAFAGRSLFDDQLTAELGRTEDAAGRSVSLADIGRGLSFGKDAGLIESVAQAAAGEITTRRGEIGARIANALEPRLRVLQEQSVRLTEARSAIMDADYARESSELFRARSLTDAAGVAVLASREARGRSVDLLRPLG